MTTVDSKGAHVVMDMLLRIYHPGWFLVVGWNRNESARVDEARKGLGSSRDKKYKAVTLGRRGEKSLLSDPGSEPRADTRW